MRTREWLKGWRRFMIAACLLAGGLISAVPLVEAHNNPGFKEVLLLRVEVTSEPLSRGALTVYSEAFELELPKKTIELVWRVADGQADGVTFAVAQGDSLHAEGLSDGATSRILRGGDVRIVEVEGATGSFSIDVFANVIDRSKPADS